MIIKRFASWLLSCFINFYFCFIYLFLTFSSQGAEPDTKGALENRCLTTALKIIEKHP